ncbi:hypothetical protein PRMUPPPA20_07670 [Xylanibacter ruminicola]|uniref:Uncharacterized protein n=1 Tax=Xylanibacter ruminicola TaxID=839 RepID=A0AA37MF61_XYLRU|nr:hypothetical protein PRMUPPPA20_07670 [Xylanibacter ruminicola]
MSEETWSAKCGNREALGTAKNVFERFIPTKKCEDKEIREKESNPKNIPHEEVFIGCTIIGIIFDSCIA